MTHPLDGCFAKIRRVQQHVRDFKRQLRRFEKSRPYTVLSQHDPKTGYYVPRFHAKRQAPETLALLLGDAVHNLRSALDHLACQLVRVNRAPVTDKIGFPVNATVGALKKWGLSKLSGASKEAIRRVRRLKPYKRGNKALWAVHCLDIDDKHKMLIPMWGAITEMTDSGPALSGKWIDLVYVRKRAVLLKEGTNLNAFFPADDTIKMKMHRKFSAYVTLGDLVEREPAIVSLDKFVNLVEGIVHQFADLFPTPRKRGKRLARKPGHRTIPKMTILPSRG